MWGGVSASLKDSDTGPSGGVKKDRNMKGIYYLNSGAWKIFLLHEETSIGKNIALNQKISTDLLNSSRRVREECLESDLTIFKVRCKVKCAHLILNRYSV